MFITTNLQFRKNYNSIVWVVLQYEEQSLRATSDEQMFQKQSYYLFPALLKFSIFGNQEILSIRRNTSIMLQNIVLYSPFYFMRSLVL
jgi:hypothetical protein